MPDAPSADEVKWYYRPAWVLVMLFVVLGPLGLPYLWKSPAFSRGFKTVLTVLLVAYMAFFLDGTIRMMRAMMVAMNAAGTGF